ncbi:Putative ribosomal N-acetyltransferase YdaF [Vibrio aerogenes CECT 7868]|uniref:Putative ribosomal N-acetyltransferase YdaF n=1 Tax=Vibrio aerogenes CECT 7868 TaxID=1216006 RepID=A0A1M5UVJ5_9VIBR|nr:GNAT family N-acetyltransferase [Vibrio aerogenes]SHH67001.1 Putative ribosomal N-acetyltransferase YdaF [Vibrio aerogenes CECT 7868]
MLNSETSRIRLTAPSVAHAAEVYDAIQESKTVLEEYLPWVPEHMTQAFVVSTTEEAIQNFETCQKELRLTIWHRQTNCLLGMIGLIIRDMSVPYFEIGYWLRTSVTGHGYASEAVGLVEQYAIEKFGALRIEIKAASCNMKSRAVAERCGYQFDGILRNARRLPSGKLAHTAIYSKTYPE